MKATGVEKKANRRIRSHPDHVVMPHQNSVMEGFEYFETAEYKEQVRRAGERVPHVLFSHPLPAMFRLLGGFVRNLGGVMSGIRRNFVGIEPYLRRLESGKALPSTDASLLGGYPNEALWSELSSYAWEKHRAVMGFTELPAQYVFAGKAVLFRHALVFVQEMRQEPIEQAPEVDAGIEVITVYNSLGQATNDIARWLRERGVVCQASHPLGGLVDTTPLAEKAGMGWIGHSGLLLTPQFGPRCRISPIFVDEKLFEYTDGDDHAWVEDFCASCHQCERVCPQSAILSEKRVTVPYGNGLRDRTETIDRGSCFLYFSRTMGCALCIKHCPFSKKPDQYQLRKAKTLG